MSPVQERLRKLRERQSKERQRMAEFGMAESLTDEDRAELDRIEAGTPDLERQIRAAVIAVENEDREAKVNGADDPNTADPEQRERIELRLPGGRGAGISRQHFAAGRRTVPKPSCSKRPGWTGFPSSYGSRRKRRQTEDRAITAAPSTVGVNLDTLRPYVFAPSVVDKLSVEMPMVPSGTYASGTITTASTAGAVPKGGSGTTGDVPRKRPPRSRSRPRPRTASAQACGCPWKTLPRSDRRTSSPC